MSNYFKNHTGSGSGLGSGSGIGSETVWKVGSGSGYGSEKNHSGSTTLHGPVAFLGFGGSWPYEAGEGFSAAGGRSVGGRSFGGREARGGETESRKIGSFETGATPFEAYKIRANRSESRDRSQGTGAMHKIHHFLVFSIPDQGSKMHRIPDPGSGFATRELLPSTGTKLISHRERYTWWTSVFFLYRKVGTIYWFF